MWLFLNLEQLKQTCFFFSETSYRTEEWFLKILAMALSSPMNIDYATECYHGFS